jgi:hypothetical protein
VPRCPEAGEPQGLPVEKTREPERTVADGPGTEERCGLGVGKYIRDGVGKGIGDRHEFRIASVCIASCGAEVRTEVLVAAETLGTGTAGRENPGHPHARSYRKALRPGAIFHNAADNLVARGDRKAGRGGSPLDLVEFRVAHPSPSPGRGTGSSTGRSGALSSERFTILSRIIAFMIPPAKNFLFTGCSGFGL